MSYMNYPRITFSGKFQADTSTVNNDPRHFSNKDFEPRFQDYQKGGEFNGWWNPCGTAIFRLAECTTTSLIDKSGKKTYDSSLTVGNSMDRPSGKLVDLDPDWQLASTIYGQVVTIRNEKNGEVLLQGEYEPYEFRDLWFGRAQGRGGDEGASAIFQSVLTGLVWGNDLKSYPVLNELKDNTEEGILSIRLITYGYSGDHTAPDFTYGTVLGAIGPYMRGEPRSFINERRFAPVQVDPAGTYNTVTAQSTPVEVPDSKEPGGISNFSFMVDCSKKRLTADLGNALPIDKNFKLLPVNLNFVVLKHKDLPQGETVTAEDYISIGTLDSSEKFLTQDSGIQTLELSKEANSLIKVHPVALIDQNKEIIIREEPDGLTLRAEKFTHRLDPNHPDENQAMVIFYSAKYGEPHAEAGISFNRTLPFVDSGDCPPDQNPLTTPKAPIPTLEYPEDVIQITPETEKTTKDGTMKVVLKGPNKFGQPRQYMDGQIYNIYYNFSNGTKTIPQTFDNLVILVFSSFSASSPPKWEEIQPILQQYANLYPIMSHGLFNFADRAQADKNANLMQFVFSKEVNDPDYMPVTRDLSYGKRKALLDYFGNITGRKDYGDTDSSISRFKARCPLHRSIEPRTKEDIEAMKKSVGYTKARNV